MAKDKFYRGHNGYSDSLCLFIKNELMPYVNSHYRTTGHTLAVGHSLGASFILESMINHELFSDYIAVSPNLAYDKDRVAEDLMKYDYSKISASRYLFISNSSEEKIHGWENWKPAREKLYQFYQKKTLPANLTYQTEVLSGI
jgi:predicted alpha/beta superfamily hydrolase